MLAGSTTAASTISTDTSPVHSPPSARPGRRRGLSYLRNYTHSHFGLDNSRTSTPPQQQESEARSARQSRRSRTAPSTSIPPSSAAFQESEGFANIGRLDLDMQSRLVQMASALGTDGSGVSTYSDLPPGIGPRPRNLTVLPRAIDAANGLNGHGPSIQFIPATDTQRTQRPSLDFRRVTRVLPNQNSVIRVGRYSERDNTHDPNPSGPSDAPIGFKSKVVSRKHCEFFFQNGQWYIKDVKSSSGTFLNHIRLSQPGLESRPFPVNDGDVVQLGIDFKGGEEMIFRCVKIRVETNRGWQRGLNKFNKSTHEQLQRLAKAKEGPLATDNDGTSKHSTECTICLNSIAPCQALFVAPCSHTWHFKCIRNLLESSSYPSFLCPNCRAQADLDADVDEEDLEDFEDYDPEKFELPPLTNTLISDDSRTRVAEASSAGAAEPPTIIDETESRHAASPISEPQSDFPSLSNNDDLAWTLSSMSLRQNSAHLASLDDTIAAVPTNSRQHHSSQPLRNDTQATIGSSSLNPSANAFVPSPSSSSTEPLPIPSPRTNGSHDPTNRHARSDTLDGSDAVPAIPGDDRMPSPMAVDLRREGPMTPRNAAGPFVFDGRAGEGEEHERRDVSDGRWEAL